jgi:hypothetical protein
VYTEERLAQILSPRHFVDVRTTLGGPAPVETARALAASGAALKTDRQWVSDTRSRLAAAGVTLRERSVQL